MSGPRLTQRVRREDLVRYAGASGDFNPIHYSDHMARQLALPGVIAHGMLTMALAARAVSEWAGGADRVVEVSVRFTAPVVVPDDEDGVEVEVVGEVGDPDEDGLVPVALTATSAGQPVLGKAVARVRPSHA